MINLRQQRKPQRLLALLVGAAAGAAVLAMATPVSARPLDADAGIDDLSMSVGDDGKLASAPASAAGEQGESGFAGDGRLNGAALPGGALPGGALPGAALPAATGSGVTPGEIGVRGVFPPDDRVRINPTTTFPASATVWITRTTGGQTRKWCSGWMYAPDMVATAGHCVHNGPGKGWVPSNELRVWPGRNGTSAPYGSCTVRAMHTVLGYSDKGQPDYDYGAITLNCTVGYSTGWYGWWWQSASLTGTANTVSGYPFDKDEGTQWTDSSTIDVTRDRRIFYFNDTYHGNSGSPVYQYRPAGSRWCVGNCVMGIHAYGSDQYNPRNSGTRIVERVFDNLKFWRDEF